MKGLAQLYSRIIVKKNSTNFMILFLSFSNVVNNILTIVAGIFVARWVLPAELGTFNTLTIVSGYIVLAQLGIPSALGRELPFYIGNGRHEEAYQFAAVGQFWQKAIGLLFLTGSAVISIVAFFANLPQVAAGSMTVGVVTWQILYVTKYLKILYRTNRDFNRLSQIKLINAIFAFASIGFVWYFGFYGLCIRAILSAIVDFVFTYWWRPIQVRAAWKTEYFRDMMRTGLPMFAVANIYGLWPLVQRTLVLSLGGAEGLGLFSLALMAENSMLTISSSLNNVIYPRMASLWGEGLSVGEIIQTLYKTVLISMLLLLLAAPIGWLLLPHVVKSFLPNYIPGIQAAQWMLVVGILEPTSAVSNIYNVMKNQRDRLKMYLAGVCLWAGTVYGLYLLFGFSLLIFPVGMVAAFLTMFILNCIHIRRHWQVTALDAR